MRMIASSFLTLLISASISSAAFAGNGFAAVASRPSTLVVLVIGIVIGAAAIVCWRKVQGK
jgi:hypothetical protein